MKEEIWRKKTKGHERERERKAKLYKVVEAHLVWYMKPVFVLI